jgi:hypothetical protein
MQPIELANARSVCVTRGSTVQDVPMAMDTTALQYERLRSTLLYGTFSRSVQFKS